MKRFITLFAILLIWAVSAEATSLLTPPIRISVATTATGTSINTGYNLTIDVLDATGATVFVPASSSVPVLANLGTVKTDAGGILTFVLDGTTLIGDGKHWIDGVYNPDYLIRITYNGVVLSIERMEVMYSKQGLYGATIGPDDIDKTETFEFSSVTVTGASGVNAHQIIMKDNDVTHETITLEAPDIINADKSYTLTYPASEPAAGKVLGVNTYALGVATYEWITPVTASVQTKNTVLAGPLTGDPAAPTFRAMAAADINIPVTNVYYVDNSRVDAYTEVGSIAKPYKTIQAAINAIAALAQNSYYAVDIATGIYDENIVLEDAGLYNIKLQGRGYVSINPLSGAEIALKSTGTNNNLNGLLIDNIIFAKPVQLTGSTTVSNFNDVMFTNVSFTGTSSVTATCLNNLSMKNVYSEVPFIYQNVAWSYIESGQLQGAFSFTMNSTLDFPSGGGSNGVIILNGLYQSNLVSYVAGGTSTYQVVLNGCRWGKSGVGVTIPVNVSLLAFNSSIRGTQTNNGTITLKNSNMDGYVAGTGTLNLDGQPASQVYNVPYVGGAIAATDVQSAINELADEKAPLASPSFTGTVTLNGATSGSVGLLAPATVTTDYSIILPTTKGAVNQVLANDATTAGTLVWVTPTVAAGDLTGTIDVDNGGTGLASYAVGDIIYASGATELSKLADVATGNALISGGTTTAPAWGKIGLTTHVSGILPGANGGTGNGFTEFTGPTTTGGVKTFTLPDASATILTSSTATQAKHLVFAGPTADPAAAPTFRALDASDIPTLDQNTTGTAANVTGTVAVANGGTNSTTALNNGRVMVSSSDKIVEAAAGTDGQVLTLVSGAPAWSATTDVLKTAKMNWFYMPSLKLDVSTPNENNPRTVNLYDRFYSQFHSPMYSNVGGASPGAVLPALPLASELNYFITYYDNTVISIVSLGNDGLLTYNVIGTPTDATFINIVFVIQ